MANFVRLFGKIGLLKVSLLKLMTLIHIPNVTQPTLLYKMPSNLKGKNFVSKFPGYCPQNTMTFFSLKLDGIKKLILQAIPAEF